jgi:hypothetical protein
MFVVFLFVIYSIDTVGLNNKTSLARTVCLLRTGKMYGISYHNCSTSTRKELSSKLLKTTYQALFQFNMIYIYYTDSCCNFNRDKGHEDICII